MLHTLTLGSATLTYEIIRSPKRKRTLEMRFLDQNTLRILAPMRSSERSILKWLEEKKPWLIAKLKSLEEAPAKNTTKLYKEGEKFLYLGEHYPLIFSEEESLEKTQCRFQENHFQIALPINLDEATKEHRAWQSLQRWYRNQAQQEIAEHLKQWSNILNLPYNAFELSDARSRWGSCDHKGIITINWRMIMVPKPLIDYVLVHELCHLRHPNHSKRFWTHVEKFLPDYRARRQMLNRFARVHGI